MPDNLLLVILTFFSVLVLTILLMVRFFITKYPRSPVFWKRSDYVYFLAAIVGASLGIVGQVSSVLQSELVGLRIERNDLNSAILPTMRSFSDACRRQAETEEHLEQMERDRREGVLGPGPGTLGKSEFKFPGYDIYLAPSDDECVYISTAFATLSMKFPENRRLAEALAEALPADEATRQLEKLASLVDNSIHDCAPFNLPRSSDPHSQYSIQLFGPSERIATLCREINKITDRLSYLRSLDPLQGFWPVFLGFAFGVRLARVHAEVKEALANEGHAATPSRLAVIPKLTASACSWIQQQLRAGFQRLH